MGLRITSAIAHSNVLDVVSVPAINRRCLGKETKNITLEVCGIRSNFLISAIRYTDNYSLAKNIRAKKRKKSHLRLLAYGKTFSNIQGPVFYTESGVGIARSGCAFCSVIPNFSPISKSSGAIPPSSFQSNEFNKDPNITGTIRVTSGNPGHILLPAPKGSSSKSLPLTSTSDSMNLSGLNANGSVHKSGSRPIAHTLTNTCAFFGIMYPQASTSVSTVRGSRNGAGGWSLRVSLMMHPKYGRDETSDSATILPLPITCSSSAFAFAIFLGLWRTSAMAHSTVLDVVSVPATNRGCSGKRSEEAHLRLVA